MHIHKRWVLVLAVTGGQLLCLATGLVWFTHWLEASGSRLVREQVLADNRLVAAQMAVLIEEIGITDPRPETPDWQRLQGMLERIRLPHDGFLCVVDARDGRLLGHPELRDDPSLRQRRHGATRLEGPGLGRRIMEAVDEYESMGGWAQMPDGTHLIGVQSMPELGIQIVAHQRDAGVQRAVATLIQPVRYGGAVLVGLLVLGSLAVTFLVVRRYEDRLANVNNQLESLVEQRTASLLKTRDAVIFGLAKLAESRDDETGEHLDRIHAYVGILAQELRRSGADLDAAQCRLMALTSSLHDIGKVGISDEILRKPGRFTPAEHARIQRHTTIGGDTLIAIKQHLGEDDFLEMACQVALAHHERWDGQGYPFGLAGEDIPLAARVVAVADVYDALTSRRVYKQAMAHEQACHIIREASGSQFDPAVVAAFERVEGRFRQIAESGSPRAVTVAAADD